MRRIAILNQKGGVGKTTTAVNVAASLSREGFLVQLFDLDPQAHATAHFGIEPDGDRPSMYDVLVGGSSIADVRRDIGERLHLIGADINLAAAEVELAGVVGREVILREAMERDTEKYDFTLVDCGPSLGVLTLNALAAVDEVLIPLQPHYFALHGLSKLLETTSLVARRINPRLKVTGIIITLYESMTRLANEVITEVSRFLEQGYGSNAPWSQARVFGTRIRRNIKLAECPSHGRTIFDYAPGCPGALDYQNLAREIAGVPQEMAVPESVNPIRDSVLA